MQVEVNNLRNQLDAARVAELNYKMMSENREASDLEQVQPPKPQVYEP